MPDVKDWDSKNKLEEMARNVDPQTANMIMESGKEINELFERRKVPYEFRFFILNDLAGSYLVQMLQNQEDRIRRLENGNR